MPHKVLFMKWIFLKDFLTNWAFIHFFFTLKISIVSFPKTNHQARLLMVGKIIRRSQNSNHEESIVPIAQKILIWYFARKTRRTDKDLNISEKIRDKTIAVSDFCTLIQIQMSPLWKKVLIQSQSNQWVEGKIIWDW